MGAEPTSVGELHRVRIEETSVGADEVELAGSERLFSVSGELADDFFFRAWMAFMSARAEGILRPNVVPFCARWRTSAM